MGIIISFRTLTLLQFTFLHRLEYQGWKRLITLPPIPQPPPFHLRQRKLLPMETKWVDQGHTSTWWGVGTTDDMFGLQTFFPLRIPSPHSHCVNCVLSWGLQGNLFLSHLWMLGLSPLDWGASQPLTSHTLLKGVSSCSAGWVTPGEFFPFLWSDTRAQTPKTTSLLN